MKAWTRLLLWSGLIFSGISGQAAPTTFSLSGSMSYTHAGSTATILPSGKVLVAGGSITSGSSIMASPYPSELYDPATGKWTRGLALTYPRMGHTASLLRNGQVLLAGGCQSSGTSTVYVSNSELFIPTSGTSGIWSVIPGTVYPRQNHTATVLTNGKVLVVGGNWPLGVSPTAEIYDPDRRTWTPTGALIYARANHTATLLPSGKVLVVGGTNANGVIGNAEIYDPATGKWTEAGWPDPRTGHSATLLPDGKVLIAGGYAANNAFTSRSQLFDPATLTWTATGQLASLRHHHTATLLPNGKVLLAGGVGQQMPYLASAELYDPASRSFTLTGTMAVARGSSVATLLYGNKVLIGGGKNSLGDLTSTEVYDATSGSWSYTGPLVTERQLGSADLILKGKVVLAGGCDLNQTALASTEVYEPDSGSWSVSGNLLSARYAHQSAVLTNGLLLVAGGSGCNGCLQSAELYNPTIGSWAPTGNMVMARKSFSLTLLADGQLLAVGGIGTGGSTLNSAEIYNPKTGTWSLAGWLTTARTGHSATLLPNNKVLVAGGTNSLGALSSAELYDPVTGLWSATGSLPTAMTSHAAVLLPNGKVLVSGGLNSSASLLALAELYDPATGRWSATGSMATLRAKHSITLLADGRALIAGGYGIVPPASGPGRMNGCEIYEPASGTWMTTGTMGEGRYGHSATLLPNGQLLVCSNGDITSSKCELYNPNSGSQPKFTLSSATLLASQGTISLTGSVMGLPGGSSGNTQDCSTVYPLVQVRSLSSGRTTFLTPYQSSITTMPPYLYLSVPVSNLPKGPCYVTVFSNAIQGVSNLASVCNGPTAASRSLATDEDTPVSILLTGSNIEGANPSFQIVQSPSKGTLSGTAPNLVYTPNPNVSGSDSFFYKVTDGVLASSVATVSITINPVNDAPVAFPQAVTTDEDTPVGITLSGSDVEGSSLTYTLLTSPSNGVISGTGANYVYTPNPNWNGIDTFTFGVNDGALDSGPATFSITVNPVNDAPVAFAQSVHLNEDVSREILLTGSDIEGDPLSFAVVTGPSHGVLSGTAPALVYTPYPNYNGPDEFAFKTNDGSLDSQLAFVSLTVHPVNDPPVAAPDYAEAHSKPVQIPVLANDSDPDGNTLHLASCSQGRYGTVSISGSQFAIYSPGPGYAKSDGDSFSYVVSDGKGGLATGTVTIGKGNTKPVASADFAVCDGAPVVIPVLANDSDTEGDTLAITSVTQGASGKVSFTGTTVTYSPDPLRPSDQFTYTVSDGFGGLSTATVTVTASIPAQVDALDATKNGTGGSVLGEPNGTTLAKIGIPSIGDGGWKALAASLCTGSTYQQALLSGTRLQVLARQNQAAPDENGSPIAGAVFSLFADPVLNNAGQTAFVATLSGTSVTNRNKTGLWTDAFGGLKLVVRTGSPGPGISPSMLVGIDSVVLSDGTGTGMLAFTGRLATGVGGVKGGNDSALWAVDANGATLLLREGSFLTVDNLSVQLKRFVALGVVKGSPGQGRFAREDSVVVQAYLANGTEAILLVSPGHAPELVAKSKEPLLGAAPGMVVASFGPPSLAPSGKISGKVRFAPGSGNVTGADAEAILLGGTDGDYSQMLVRQLAPVPDAEGTSIPGVVFKQLGDPVVNAQGYAAFTATISGSGVKNANAAGIWWGKPGSLRSVARKGDLAPGTTGRFASFTSLALPDDDSSSGSVGPVFMATLSGGSAGVGLWAVNSQGNLQLVAQKGTLEMVGGVQKPIADITALAAVPGSPAQPRAYNRQRTLVYRVTFQGGGQRVVTAVIP